MNQFLIDENLPYYFNLWNRDHFVHVHDLVNVKSDTEIWEYSKKNNLVIVTKDSDFSNRILFHSPPPKVVHLKFCNVRIKKLQEILNQIWFDIEHEIESHKLINVYLDRIESIS